MSPPAIIMLIVLLFQGGFEPGQREQSYKTLFRQAALYRTRGEFEKSYESLQQALDQACRAQEYSSQGKCLVRMGVLMWDLGNMAESKRHFGIAAKAFGTIGDRRSREFCTQCLELVELYDLGKEDRRSRFYYRSIERLKRASLLGRELGIPDLQLKCLRQEALTYLDLREFGIFLDKNLLGLEISKRIGHRAEQSRCLNNIGVYYQQKSDYSQAVTQHEEALAIIRTVGDRVTEAECLNNLGLAYRELGNLSRAQHCLSEALELDMSSGDTDSISMDLSNIGSILLRRGIDENKTADLYEASKAFERCLSLQAPSGANDLVRFTALNNMGVILNELKDHDGARRHFERALMIVESGQHELEKALVFGNVGASYLDEQDIEKALDQFTRSYEMGRRHSFENVLVESSFGLGRCYEKKHDPERALSYYFEAIEAMEDMRARIETESFMIAFARNKFGAYKRAIHILADQYAEGPSEEILSEIFDLIERSRARAFLESVYEARLDVVASDLSILRDRQKAVSGIISELVTKLGRPSVSAEEGQALKREIELAEEDYARLISEMKTSGPAREKEWRKAVSRIGDIQKLLLGDRSIVLEYYLDEERSYLIWISPADAALHFLPAEEDIEKSLRAYLKFVSDHSLDPQTGFDAAERIGRELLPIGEDERLRKAGALIVIPDGILHYLPFEALRVRGAVGTRYLVEDWAVSYSPSASVFAALRATPVQARRTKALLAIGGPDYRRMVPRAAEIALMSMDRRDPGGRDEGMRLLALPFSKKEVQDITRLFPSTAADLLTGEAANEGNVKKWPLMDYRIIHFACHGFVNGHHPFRSALALSTTDPSGEDGLLQMREIYGLSIRADLVVLSACRTGRGRLERSEGPMALARSFFFAGARSVMSTLWPINDRSTVLFMHEFYKHLLGSRSAADAVRAAKIGLLHSAWAHPYFWASYLLHGEPSITVPRN